MTTQAQKRARARFVYRFAGQGKVHRKLPKGNLPPGVTRTKRGYKITGEALRKFKEAVYGPK